jgi:transposase
VTVTREANGWHISIQVEIEVEAPQHPSTTVIGVDRGIAVLAALSDIRTSQQLPQTPRAIGDSSTTIKKQNQIFRELEKTATENCEDSPQSFQLPKRQTSLDFQSHQQKPRDDCIGRFKSQ